jgi:hypothetical protein
VKWLKAQSLPADVRVAVRSVEQLPEPLWAKIAGMAAGHATMLPFEGGVDIILIRSVLDQPLSLKQSSPVIAKLIMAEKEKEALDGRLKKMRDAVKIQYGQGYEPSAGGTS